MTVAALFVETGGCYFGLPGVDPWDEARDARLYAGPWPVVAHPPCERWGRYARGAAGQDGDCFVAALRAVREWGGVLEHPEASLAWPRFGLMAPPRSGGWVAAGDGIGWTCCVEQGHYGHRARKATWLYAVGAETLPSLRWGRSEVPLTRKGHEAVTPEQRARARRTGVVQNLSRKQRRATPAAFRDALLKIADSTLEIDDRKYAGLFMGML